MPEGRPTDTPIYDSTGETLPPDEVIVPATPVPGQTTTGSGSSSGGVTDVAKEEAGRVGGAAAEAGKDVAGVAKDEVQNVAGEAKSQAQDLLRQTQQELRDQAAHQQERVASGLHSVGDELDQMAGASEAQGMASDIVRQAAQRAHSIAGWLDQRDPGSLLQELTSYARRNPGTFIAGAAIAGALAGRLTRALASGASDSSGGGSTGSGSAQGAVPPRVGPTTYEPPIGTPADFGTSPGIATGGFAGGLPPEGGTPGVPGAGDGGRL